MKNVFRVHELKPALSCKSSFGGALKEYCITTFHCIVHRLEILHHNGNVSVNCI